MTINHVIGYFTNMKNSLAAELERSGGNPEHVAEVISVHVTVLAQMIAELSRNNEHFTELMEKAHFTLDLAATRFLEERKNAQRL